MNRSRIALVALVAAAALLAGVAPTAQARPAQSAPASTAVLDWNAHAIAALVNAPTAPTPGAGQPPQVSAPHLAMVQAAVYDAVNSIVGSHEPYLAGLPAAPATASLDAAVATAAHHVLVGVVVVPPLAPAVVARLDDLYAQSLAAVTDGPDEDAGVAAGAAAAAAMLADRADDGRYVPFAFPTGAGTGQWRPTPPANVNDPFAWVANVRPFTLESAAQVASNGPDPIQSMAYARDYDEVYRLGGPIGQSERTLAQEAMAQFFTANPVELLNRTFRTIAGSEGLSTADQARLFATIGLAGADALIGCWDDKVRWSFWRPITAIHDGDADGNRFTVGDPTWAPMVANPPYPDQPSGYNCVTAAMMHSGWHFFDNDRMSFRLVRPTPGAPDVVREYERFTDVVDDTIDARIYLGIHFRDADEDGARLGRRVAEWVDAEFLQPVS
jgi:hypothetical protein